ncbi:MAG: hypothetical protein LBS92_04050 [Candidatus Methanoplasma sp.]|jgi:hypothetical protein|nr:hypothetical protein [Candidatus Methanoplasma sp.]
MALDALLEKIRSRECVTYAFLLEGDALREALEEEAGVGTLSGMPMENRALAECLGKEVAVCMFCNGVFEQSSASEHIMVMEDGRGNVVGHDVSKEMAVVFKDDPEVFWLCDDFVMYPGRASIGDIKMVMLPKRIRSLGESDGVRNPVILYPATTTDLILKRRFDVAADSRVSSAILAFDVAR